jgi:hypothetical protein
VPRGRKVSAPRADDEMYTLSPGGSATMVKSTSCSECADQRRELERARQLFLNIRLSHGSGSATRSLERRISTLEVSLFRHRCPADAAAR